MIVVLIRTCIGFLIRKPFLIVKRLLLLPSVEPERQESVAGDPYRKEVRENHLGAQGAENFLLDAKNASHAFCHRHHIQ